MAKDWSTNPSAPSDYRSFLISLCLISPHVNWGYNSNNLLHKFVRVTLLGVLLQGHLGSGHVLIVGQSQGVDNTMSALYTAVVNGVCHRCNSDN